MTPRFLLALSIAALFAFAACGDDYDGSTPDATSTIAPGATVASSATDAPDASSLRLTSSAFNDGDAMPVEYTCDGNDTSPPLAISGVPDEAAALALTVVDTDVPNGGFVHWTVWNIGPATTEVAQGAVPSGGIEGQTSRGSPGYFGPCPPTGMHHYVFTLYALDAALVLDPAVAGRAEIEDAVQGHVLATAELAGAYERSR
ncbi:MAG: YbhB/YbcL family Raf kinase inhibitor-like protein [Dehalococcoidia bacterium]